MSRIPFIKPYTGTEETEKIQQVFSTHILRGDGAAGKRVQSQLCDLTGCRYVFFTTSCTHALEMAMLAAGVGEGDEVIMPSFTFVSSANAAVLLGAKPVFADILSGTLNIDPEDIIKKITPRTKAIIPVHYSGTSCEMDEILDIGRKYGIYVVEDAAQGIDSYYRSRHLGSLGDMGCVSFHDTKNITCGEGGAFLTNSEEIARKIEIIREKGTNRSAFLRGEVDKYTWVNRGSSYVQSDILAGVLEAQLSKRVEIRTLRKQAWEQYYTVFQPIADRDLIDLPLIPDYCDTNYHSFFITTRRTDDRDPLIDAFKKAGVSASFHYVPLHTSPYGLQISSVPEYLPKTDYLANAIVRLPLFPSIHKEYPDFADRVKTVVTHFFK